MRSPVWIVPYCTSRLRRCKQKFNLERSRSLRSNRASTYFSRDERDIPYPVRRYFMRITETGICMVQCMDYGIAQR